MVHQHPRIMSLFIQEFQKGLEQYLKSEEGKLQIEKAESQQSQGVVSRLFNNMTPFSDECEKQAYEKCKDNSDILNHVKSITREAVKDMFNADMTDLSDKMKQMLGDHYSALIDLCVDKNPQDLVNLLLQATVTLYSEAITSGLSQVTTAIEKDSKLTAKEKNTQKMELKQQLNDNVSNPITR